jgi:hypothetical protein
MPREKVMLFFSPVGGLLRYKSITLEFTENLLLSLKDKTALVSKRYSPP